MDKTVSKKIILVIVLVLGVLSPLATVVIFTGKAYAVPNFQMPFQCGEGWWASTYDNHYAIDWNDMTNGDDGRTVVASLGGTATASFSAGYGYYVLIDHGDGWKTRYAHLKQPGVSGIVSQGQAIGQVGNTGNSEGSHLHWEQIHNGARQDPLYANGSTLQPGTAYNSSDPLYISNNNCGPANPDDDNDGIINSQDDCPVKAGNPNPWFYGCPEYTPPASNSPQTAESPYGTTLSSWGEQRLDAFRVNSSGELEHRSFGQGAWTSWENLGGDIVGKPAAVSWGWGRIDVFGIGSDGKLKQKFINNNTVWSPWYDLSGLPNTPTCLKDGLTVSTWGSGRLDIFGVGCNDALKHLWLNNNQWQTWEDLGGCIKSAPAATSWGQGRIDVFARACNNKLVTKFVDANDWSGWGDMGGCLSSGPSVASQAPERLDVFARGCALNSLLHKAYRPNVWSPWENWGGNIAQAPSAVSWGSNRLDVISTDPNNQTRHFHFDREAPGSGWNSL